MSRILPSLTDPLRQPTRRSPAAAPCVAGGVGFSCPVPGSVRVSTMPSSRTRSLTSGWGSVPRGAFLVTVHGVEGVSTRACAPARAIDSLNPVNR
jgi:hypothetical protein